MKFIYIAGIEHSGTTLTEQLLSSHPRVLSLGEITSFFSPSHMHNYMARWGGYADVSTCSCGQDWSQCSFWSELMGLSGLNSTLPLQEKYRILIEAIVRRFGSDVIVTDSSKSLQGLTALHEASHATVDAPAEISVVFTVKDPRSFAASMKRKTSAKGLFAMYRAMNLWTGSNREIMSNIRTRGLSMVLNLYEHLCMDPLQQINMLLQRFGVDPVQALDVSHRRSHIAMGNKDFLMRNRLQVRYDQRWFLDDSILMAYLLNRKAGQFNRSLYALSEQQRTERVGGSGRLSPAG
jgi:hypothetical protein